jgi:anti-anti-sigma regulatory factor
MNLGRHSAQVTATPVRGSLILAFPTDLSPSVFEQARELMLAELWRGEIHTVLFELSSVDVMDGEDFGLLRKIVDTTRLLGARCLLVGFNPGVVIHLVQTNVGISGLEVVRDLEQGLERAGTDGKRGAESLAAVTETGKALNPGKLE